RESGKTDARGPAVAGHSDGADPYAGGGGAHLAYSGFGTGGKCLHSGRAEWAGGMGGCGCSAGADGRLSPRADGADDGIWISQPDMGTFWPGLRASALQFRSADRAGTAEVSRIHRPRGGPGIELWRLAKRGAWGRAVAGGTVAENVRAGAGGCVSGVQAPLGPGQPDESGEAVGRGEGLRPD